MTAPVWTRHYDYWVPPTMNYPRRSLYEILRTAAAELPDRPACHFGGAELSYLRLKELSDHFGRGLAAMGIRKGDRVGIMLPNCPQYAVAVFGTLRQGGTIVNINPAYTRREVDVICDDAELRAIVTLDTIALALELPAGRSAPATVIVTALQEFALEAAAPPATPGTTRFAAVLSRGAGCEAPVAAIDADEDLAVLQFTGGTTGFPKAAMLTHANIFANVIQKAIWTTASRERGQARFLMVIPYFHVYGLTVGLMMGTWMGALQILIPKYDADVVLDAIKELRPTFFPAVPTIYASLLKHPRLMESRPDLVQTYNSGSAPLPATIRAGFEQQTGATINEGYGLSEASPVTHSMPLLAGRRLGSVGVPLPDTLVKLVDLATGDREAAAGEAGELCVAGPQIMKGYWRQPEETARAIRLDADGRRWLHTGDIARIDPDGFTHIVGRKKDLIIVDGFNVYPSEVENVLRMCPGVLEAAVVGVSDAYHGETVHAAVVVQEGGDASPERIRRYCGQHLAPYKVPAAVTLRSALPRSPVGKVLYRVLRDDAREEAAAASVGQ